MTPSPYTEANPPGVRPGHGADRRAGHSAWRIAATGHRDILLMIGAYVAAGFLAERLTGFARMMDPLWNLETFALFYGVALYSAGIVLVMLRWRARDAGGQLIPGRAGWRAAAGALSNLITSPRGAGVLLMLGVMPLFMNAFGSWKAAIPHLHPFTWDDTFMRLDRRLHGGVDAWQFLGPLLRSPAWVAAWDYGYTLFIPAQTAVLLWQIWAEDSVIRLRFLRCYVLSWVLLGTIAAALFSSAGPCFYSLLVPGADPYEPLVRTLRTIGTSHPLDALEAQRLLWTSHVQNLAIPFTGISAMPSMHVALPTLFVLVSWNVNIYLRLVFLAYLAFNLIGSVLLGWHYAVDGYAGIAGVVLIWAALTAIDRKHPLRQRR